MSAEDILGEYAAVTGWDAASLLAVALEYIDALEATAGPSGGDLASGDLASGDLASGEAFRAFVRERAAEEAGMAGD